MAVSVCVIVANIYYIQPLLADVAKEFHLTVTRAGLIAMLMQAGTAVGMLLFVPLGDTHERRALICRLVLCAAVSLMLVATARNAVWLGLAGVALGLCASTVHVIVPYAAHLAPPDQRGRVLGFVFSGVLCGVLLARTFSGYVGEHFGWRSVFWIAAAGMVVVCALIRWQLPPSQPELSMPWIALVRSSADLAKRFATLREAAAIGGLTFGAFSAFWTTLVFRLGTPPFHYGATVAGLFGLVGAAGALGAPIVGHFADRRGPRNAVLIALIVGVIAWLIMLFGGDILTGLIAGVVLLDLAVQAAHVANQTRIYGLDPDARSRLNMFYMVCYFIGGASGSYLGALAWRLYQWKGVCLLGLAMFVPGIYLVLRRQSPRRVSPMPGEAL